MTAAERLPVQGLPQERIGRIRAAAEMAAGYGLIVAVIWTPRPLQRELYLLTAAALLVMLVLGWRGAAAVGMRWGNLLRSLWVTGAAAMVALGAVVLAARLGTLHLPPTPEMFFRTYIGYAIWSFVQQVLLLDFFLRRMLVLLPRARWAVVATAGIFTLAHLPNPVLAPVTLLWGLASCVLFLRYRNIFPLAMAHAIFGICIAVTVPGPVSRNMRVGLGYLRYHAPVHGVMLKP